MAEYNKKICNECGGDLWICRGYHLIAIDEAGEVTKDALGLLEKGKYFGRKFDFNSQFPRLKEADADADNTD